LAAANQFFSEKAEEIQKELIKWRRHIHMHPELSFSEKETATFVRRELEKVPGVKIQTNAGYPTAVVGTISNGEGPTVAIRADTDALPIDEKNDCSYQSVNPGVMHACGHDAHTAIVLGACRLLSDYFQNEKTAGTVKFLFQPAEEHVDEVGLSGASYMIESGVLDGTDGVFALHMDPERPVGEVKLHDGYSMANVDVFQAKVLASGGHGAYPHLGSDPIWMLNNVLSAIYSITSRHISPMEPAVISVGKIRAGDASNVIPSEVEIEGTIRSYHPEVRQQLLTEVEKAIAAVKTFHGDYQLNFLQEDVALFNDEKMNQFLKRAIHHLYPNYKINDTPFGLGGEDFAYMAKEVPGAMIFLGCGLPDREGRNLHTSYFDIDEEVLPIGASILAEAAIQFLQKGEVG